MTLFTTSKPDAVAHTCVVVFDKTHAVSFRHGQHSSLEIAEPVTLYNVLDPSMRVETVVHAVSDSYDIVVFKMVKGEFSNYPHALGSIFRGQTYKQLGICSQREHTWKEGTVAERRVGFFVGSSYGKIDDSGSGIFNYAGHFLGISVAKKSFVFNDCQNMPIAEVADHFSDTKIISSDTILTISEIIGPDAEFDPPKKKHASGAN
ncbi:unnamed protein product [Caenorhabditis sp. 36 PRJEB53466]|nr:unnamed protein product [Caenorhabditis sp. 36 PRJEB53466]